jgi:hypothetical protein
LRFTPRCYLCKPLPESDTVKRLLHQHVDCEGYYPIWGEREAIAALDAAGYEVRPQKAGACCDEPTLVCTTCGDAHVHGDPRPDHERLAGAWHVWLAEKERIEAEAVAAERQRIKAAVEALATIGSFDTTGLHESKMVNRSHVLAIIDGADDA